MTPDHIEHIHRIVRQANPVPDPSVLDRVDPSLLLVDDHRRTDMRTYDDVADARVDNASRRRGLLPAAVSTAAAIIVVTVLLAWPNGDGRDQASVAGRAPVAATQVAATFLDALAGHDVEGAAGLLGVDALAQFGGLDGLRRELEWRQASGFQLLPGACRQQAESGGGATVTCPYAFHGVRSQELGHEPYRGSRYLFLVRDGRIVSFSDTFEHAGNGFAAEVWEPFAEWLAATHPADVAVMYTPGDGDYSTSDTSIRLWEQRTQEYVAQRTSRAS